MNMNFEDSCKYKVSKVKKRNRLDPLFFKQLMFLEKEYTEEIKKKLYEKHIYI